MKRKSTPEYFEEGGALTITRVVKLPKKPRRATTTYCPQSGTYLYSFTSWSALTLERVLLYSRVTVPQDASLFTAYMLELCRDVLDKRVPLNLLGIEYCPDWGDFKVVDYSRLLEHVEDTGTTVKDRILTAPFRKTFTLQKGFKLASGAYGSVYSHPQDTDTCVKVSIYPRKLQDAADNMQVPVNEFLFNLSQHGSRRSYLIFTSCRRFMFVTEMPRLRITLWDLLYHKDICDEDRLDVFRYALVSSLEAILGFKRRTGCNHNDVSPLNIMYDTEGNAHLIDFGCAGLASTGRSGVLFPKFVGSNQGAPDVLYFLLDVVFHGAHNLKFEYFVTRTRFISAHVGQIVKECGDPDVSVARLFVGQHRYKLRDDAHVVAEQLTLQLLQQCHKKHQDSIEFGKQCIVNALLPPPRTINTTL